MTSHIFRLLLPALVLLTGFVSYSNAQWVRDLGRQIEIPDITTIESSETHLYVLSEREGLVVFRAHSDSLQWLYSSSGMQERGHILESDIRFAYLYGNNRRLTVIEPTSVLGVYSSTILPAPPLSVKRAGLQLFIAMGDQGLGIINLETPESVDSEVVYPEDQLSVIDLATDHTETLYALNSKTEISVYDIDEDNIRLQERVEADRPVARLFLTNDTLLGTDGEGNIFEIGSEGNTRTIARVSGPVERLDFWNDILLVRTENGELWTASQNGDPRLWKSDREAGNYFTVSENQLWVSEFNGLAPVIETGGETGSPADSRNGEFALKPIRDVTFPAPRPLIVPIEFETNVDPAQVSLSYSAPFTNARIRGNSFYWQPSSNQTGRHNVTITATTADGRSANTSFTIDVRPFNSPPRFTPARPVTIPAGEEYELEISAVDPDGPDQSLIRYLGVDLPQGASLEETTGRFVWTPEARHVGEHRFRVVATDQFGAAASQNFTVNVIEIEEEPAEDDIFDSDE